MSWNHLEDQLWYNPGTWNWNPQCEAPSYYKIVNASGFNISVPVTKPCTEYCSGFLYPLFWQIDEIRTLVYPVFLYILGVLYTFFAIAIICDEFFVPALERVSDKYGISADVAGATLMAAGGSAPELATSFIGTVNESPVGFGTIVGSAVFNVLFVIGACAFAAPDELKLDWWPLFRDSSYYCFSLLVLTIFFGYSSPSRIYWWEALSLFLLYILYVVMMSQNTKLEACVNSVVSKCKRKKEQKPSEIAVHPAPGAKKSADKGDEMTKEENEASVDAGVEEKKNLLPKDVEEAEIEKEGGDDGGDDDNDDDGEDSDDDEEPFEITWPKMEDFEHHKKCPKCQLRTAQVFAVILFPLNILFYATVPDVRREDGKCCGKIDVSWKNWWLPALILSIGWIGFFSFMMVWWVEILGEWSGADPTVMGLTILAMGTSIPDLVSSVLVARKGEGNMAVSSSIGSNIFDILVGLPLPWLFYSVFTGIKKWDSCSPKSDCFYVGVFAETLLFSVFVLVLMIFLVILIVHCSGWKMTKTLGIAMLILYIFFVLQDIMRNCNMVPGSARWLTWLRSNT